MKKLNSIAAIENDKHFLAMLKGYCYANNIAMKEIKFNFDGLNELKQLTPALIVFPLDWACTNMRFDEALKRAGIRNQVKICGLKKKPSDIISVELSEWVDVIIIDPFDIGAIDDYIKQNFLLGREPTENRRGEGRRTFKDRRAAVIKHNDDDGNREKRHNDYHHEPGKLGFRDFKIDHRDKSLVLNGLKVELSPKEYELIELLLTDIDRIFKAEEIINHLWPENKRATKSDLYQYMHLLRKKIEKDPNNPQWIMNIKGFGYKLCIDNIMQTTRH